MTGEAEAREWLTERNVPRETLDQLQAFAAMIIEENQRQNLISQSTEAAIWHRHILDSAQLAFLPAAPEEAWVDIGSGQGLPGIVIGLITKARMRLVENRPLRCDFLRACVDRLSIADRIDVIPLRIERVPADPPTTTITARAFAPLQAILAAASHLAGPDTNWILPKGRTARAELATASTTWQGTFHVEQSITDPDASIIVARDVRRRSAR